MESSFSKLRLFFVFVSVFADLPYMYQIMDITCYVNIQTSCKYVLMCNVNKQHL